MAAIPASKALPARSFAKIPFGRYARLAPFAAFAVCVAVWGSTWLVIKVGYAGIGPFTAASVRFLVAGAVLLLVAFVLRIPLPKSRVEWGLVAWIGLLQFALDYGLIYWGEQYIASGLTAVLFATLPLWTVLAAHFYVPGERANAGRVVGVVIGFAGVAVLFEDRLLSALDAPLLPMVAILASAVAVALTTVAAKRHGHGIHPVTLTGPAALIGGAALVPVSLVAGEGYHVPPTWDAWWPIVYLAILGSVVTFLLYYWLLKRWSTTNASFISVFTPLVALLLGAAVLAEPLAPAVLVGTGLILAGVVLSNRATRSPRARKTP